MSSACARGIKCKRKKKLQSGHLPARGRIAFRIAPIPRSRLPSPAVGMTLALHLPMAILGVLTPAPVRPRPLAPLTPALGATAAAPSRRAILLGGLTALPAGLLMAPLSAQAVCSCPKGFDSCVCTDDDTAVKGVTRLDAAGRDAKESAAEIAGIRAMAEPEQKAPSRRADSSPALKGRRAPPREQQAAATLDSGPTYVMPDRNGLTGGGTQEYGDMDKTDARRRYLSILFETVAKREAEYGFELDAKDIQQVDSVLRIKYCGPQGLIGPC